MKEKKQTNKLSYSALGKHFRGFLCMVTFVAFCVSTILTIYALEIYGTKIIMNPTGEYTETAMYQADVSSEISQVLSYCNLLDMSDTPYGEIDILDMSDQRLHYCDKEMLGEDLYYGRFNASYIEDMSFYEKNEALTLEDMDLLDYEQMKAYLKDSEYSADYLYFDQKTFRKLFEKDGLQNTDHRFSESFSEDAYFIFENFKVTTSQNEEEEKEAQTTEVAIEDVTTEVAAKETLTEVKVEEATEAADVSTTEVVADYELADGVEGEVSVVKKTVTQPEIVITPYNLTSYAVYDPEQDVYYSTQDEYFSEMETYIYDTGELLTWIEEGEKEGNYYNSLVIPLLRSYNNSLYEVAQTTYAPYANMIEAQHGLDQCEGRGIYYYLALDDSYAYTNVENEEVLQTMDYYRFEKVGNGNLEQAHSTHLPDIEDLYALNNFSESASVGATFFIAFEANMDDIWYAYQSEVIRHDAEYPFFRDYTLVLAIVVIVSFILLMIQAIWLILTTGKKYKGDTEISLNFYDRMYTEIWLVISGGIMLIGCVYAISFMDQAFIHMGLFYMIVCTVLAALIFGIPFMLLVLSLERRIKAHNIWNHLLIVKLVKFIYNKIKNRNVATEEGEVDELTKKESPVAIAISKAWSRVKQAIYKVKGTRKLLVLFVLHMIIGTALMVTAIETRDGMPSVLFLLLQALALVVVLFVVRDLDKLTEGVEEITKGNLDSKVEINEKVSVFGDLAHGINHIGDGLKRAVETSLKDERMKTELITNVSHDLKTPLTSIINYIDLLKKENIPGEDAKHYIEVLDAKSQRLKQLTEDLVEAAKATSGNIELEMMPLTFDELMKQALGEFEDKYEKKNLTIIASYPEEPAVVIADGRRLFRIIENVLQNIYKYAMEGTRVYADLSKEDGVVTFTLKNVSAAPLNISADELMERFTRGDSSRTTEGSGLGLSIAKDLTRLQNGEFEIQLDGDLFKVIIRFPEHR